MRTADNPRLHVSLTSLVLRRVPELNIFAGLLTHEIALSRAVSERTVKNDWRVAHVWPKKELASDGIH